MDPFTLLMLGALGLLIFFMFRNQRKQRQAQLELQEKLVPGAEVMTSFGLFATLVSLDDENNTALIDAGAGTVLKVHRQVLSRVVEDEPAAESGDEESGAGKPARDTEK